MGNKTTYASSLRTTAQGMRPAKKKIKLEQSLRIQMDGIKESNQMYSQTVCLMKSGEIVREMKELLHKHETRVAFPASM